MSKDEMTAGPADRDCRPKQVVPGRRQSARAICHRPETRKTFRYEFDVHRLTHPRGCENRAASHWVMIPSIGVCLLPLLVNKTTSSVASNENRPITSSTGVSEHLKRKMAIPFIVESFSFNTVFT